MDKSEERKSEVCRPGGRDFIHGTVPDRLASIVPRLFLKGRVRPFCGSSIPIRTHLAGLRFGFCAALGRAYPGRVPVCRPAAGDLPACIGVFFSRQSASRVPGIFLSAKKRWRKIREKNAVYPVDFRRFME